MLLLRAFGFGQPVDLRYCEQVARSIAALPVQGERPIRASQDVRVTLAATIYAAQNAMEAAIAEAERTREPTILPGMDEAFERADALLEEWGVEVDPPGDFVAEVASAFRRADPVQGEREEEEESQVRKRWIILQRGGWAPEKKVPRQTHDGVTTMLREIRDLYPDASAVVVELTHDDDLWLTEATEWLSLEELAASPVSSAPEGEG
jgi:hypothetical protein